MKNLTVELKKCKRTGILVVLPLVGLLGALYAFINFIVRKEVFIEFTAPAYGRFADTTLWNGYGS